MRNGQKRDRACELRKDMTLAERKLWSILKAQQLDGYRFRCQMPVGPYVADFACLAASLIIEVDGGQHLESASDAARDSYLARQGFRVLRFWNNDVLANLEGVRAVIAQRLSEACPHPNPVSSTGQALPPQTGEGAEPEG
ncbi:endonuclease domain-containing protein [Pseudoxanthomonas sp. UTMC 1351]|uniref:endonuclease domain-containing protein n=1 Tax=Pseudoxanthomonas sp. UTMC 1351 TaxID=2695853 RepID=UPI0034CFA724